MKASPSELGLQCWGASGSRHTVPSRTRKPRQRTGSRWGTHGKGLQPRLCQGVLCALAWALVSQWQFTGTHAAHVWSPLVFGKQHARPCRMEGWLRWEACPPERIFQELVQLQLQQQGRPRPHTKWRHIQGLPYPQRYTTFHSSVQLDNSCHLPVSSKFPL